MKENARDRRTWRESAEGHWGLMKRQDKKKNLPYMP